MALARERDTHRGNLSKGTYPVAANVTIYKGALVVLNASGHAIPGNTIANGARTAVGMASHTIAGGSVAGVNMVEVEFGVFGWSNSAAGDEITQAHVGHVVYVVDDFNVARTSGTGARIGAGVCTEVRDGIPFVDMSPTISAAAEGEET